MARKQYTGVSRWLQYIFARALIGLLTRIPISLAYRLGRCLGWLIWLLLASRRRIVRNNLRIIQSWAEDTGHGDLVEGMSTDQQVRETFMRNGANLICGFSLAGMSSQKLAKHLDFRGGELLADATKDGTGAILLLSHMGPWEALAHLPELFRAQNVHGPLGAVYRRFNNDYMDHWYKSRREHRGTTMFSSRYKFYAPVDFVRQGGILGVLSDQRASGGKPVTYFGRATTATPLPGLIHLRTKAPWFAMSLSTIGFAKWRITLRPAPSHLEEGADRSREALAQTTADTVRASLMESILDGFWINNRFKN